MYYSGNFPASAAVLILTTFATALPVNEVVSDLNGATFNVTQVLNPGHVRNGAQAYAKALARYGAPVSEDLKAAALKTATANGLARRQGVTGSDTATPAGGYDAEYLAPVQIGTPPQTLNLDFDTGSADLWTFSTETPTNQRNGQTLYNPATSGSKLQGQTWDISYGDNSGARGDVYADKVAIGGVTVTRQAVEAATSVSAEFSSDSSCSGLVGFAFSSINTVTPQVQTTWFENVKSSLAAPLFTSRLAYNKAGTYTFGKIDATQYVGNIAYTPVDKSQGFWGFTGSGYAVGRGAFTSSSINGVLDTGTSLLLLPDAVLTAYYSKVRGATNSNTYGGYVFPCSATLPSFSYGVGNYRAIIPAQYMNYAPVETGSATCYGGIQSNDGIGMSIYGDIALKSQYVVWDYGSTRLGFAQQAAISATDATNTATKNLLGDLLGNRRGTK